MQISRQQHWQFLEDELKAETEEFNKKFLTTAISLLQNSEEMYVGQLVSFRGGEMIVKLANTRALPRKGEFLECMLLPQQLRNYRNWGELTYRDLYKQRYISTDSVCIWHSAANDKQFSLVGFNRVSVDFAEAVSEAPGVILVFAPQRPPIDYSLNLQRLTKDTQSKGVADVLDMNYSGHDWEPIPVKSKDTADFVYNQLNLCDSMILQGPPGTGKTYMIASLCAKLCSEGKSVLVTALTNRALMEIADKPAMEKMLNDGKIYKTGLSMDERTEQPKLTALKQVMPIPSALVLSTYYIISGFAADATLETPFDYVIMDEASQAILAMFAASKKLGKKNLWVGDIKRLSPIVQLNKDRIRICKYQNLVDGLKVLADNSSLPIYQLTNTFRFGKRGASYTGIFYNNTLQSRRDVPAFIIQSLRKILHDDGGPTLVYTDMESGNSSPEFAIMLAAYIVNCIHEESRKTNIAVLSCMRKSTRDLQKAIVQNVGSYPNILVDTVARIQGLTTDIAIFFIPNVSYIRTADAHLFNVATSRAKDHSIIIADKNILEYPTIKSDVRAYLTKLSKERSIYIPSQNVRNETKFIKQILGIE